MKNCLIKNDTKKKRINPFITIGLVFSIILLALMFAALDVSVEETQAEASFTSGENATITAWGSASTNSYAVGLGSKRLGVNRNRHYYRPTLTFSEKAGALYRNGAIKMEYKVVFTTPTHKDYGGMKIWGTNFTTQEHGKQTGDWTRYLYASPSRVTSGSAKVYVVYHEVWADDDDTWLINYDTDSNVTCTNTVSKSSTDTTGPTLKTLNYVNNDENTWKANKQLNIELTDNLAGVDPNSIKINGISYSHTQVTEDGREVKDIYVTVSTSGTNNLVIEAKDYFGNSVTIQRTIPKIDPTAPVIHTNMHAVNGVGVNTWTKGNATLSATAYDDLSGLDTMKVGNTTYTIGSAGSVVTNVTKTYEVTTNGTYTGFAKNHTGATTNFSSVTITKIDKVAPNLSIYVRNASTWTNSDVTVYISVTGVASNETTTGVSPIRPTSPIVIATPGVAPPYAPTVTAGSGTIDGFTYTHRAVLDRRNGRIEYRFQAFDKAENGSEYRYCTPNIDTVRPNISSIDLRGYKLVDGVQTQVNAKNNYSFTNISVTINCADVASGSQGVSGIDFVRIYDGNTLIGESTENKTSYLFSDLIYKNTIVQNTYKVEVKDKAGNYYQNSVSLDLFETFKPLKDSEMPDAKAIGSYNWQNVEGVGQNINADVWTGLSGGEVFMKRTYLGGINGTTIQTEIKSVKIFPANTNMYNAGNRIFSAIPVQNIRNEGEEFYHFMVVSGAGAKTAWLGLGSSTPNTGGVPEGNTTSMGSAPNWVFTSNGARTRIDNTPPQVTSLRYSNGSVDVDKARFINGNYLAESIYGYYLINDGFETNGVKTQGINSSGLNGTTGLCVSYTITYGLTPANVGLITNDGEQIKYAGEWSVAKFRILFSNQGLTYNGTTRVPKYTITVTDKAGNQTIIVEEPYLDDQAPTIEISSVKQIINESTTQDYNYLQEQQWTKNSIVFTFNKTFGQSGAKISWYISPTKSITCPTAVSEDWLTETSSTWGTILDTSTSTTSTITIPTNNSFDATIFFIIRSNAKNLNNVPLNKTLYQKKVDLIDQNFYIAVDNSKPNIVGYEFRDSSNRIIEQSAWSSTNVYLYVNATDQPTGTLTNVGSGIKDVRVTIKDSQTSIPMQIVDNNPNTWRSVNLIGSNEYSIIIEDNVGHICDYSGFNQSRYNTWRPNIDSVMPQISVTGFSYDSLKGSRTSDAVPTKSGVGLKISSIGDPPNIASGGSLYYKERPKNEYDALKYTQANIDIVGQGWQFLIEVDKGDFIRDMMITIGGEGEEFYNGYDFVVVSGSGLMGHVDYGTVFVDRSAPQLNISKIQYIRDDGLPADDIIVPEGQIGNWTNASVTAKLYVEDGIYGSGINPSKVTLNDQPWLSTEGLNGKNDGYYIFILDEHVEYVLKYEDVAGNAGSYKIKPLIDRDPISISLNAIDGKGNIYNINPLDPGGVRYINTTITITIDIQYGLSAFTNIQGSSYAKGDELYQLIYKFYDNGELKEYNITEMIDGSSNKWENPVDGSKFTFERHDSTMARYTMVLSKDQNRFYHFEVHNGIQPSNISASGPSSVAYPPFQIEGNYPTVKIDVTPPEIIGPQYKSGGQNIAITEWTDKSITAYFQIEDNEYGSGVLEDGNKSVIVVKRDLNLNVLETFKLNDGTNKLIRSEGYYIFVMDGYYNYYIEYEDSVGNGRKTADYGILDGKVVGKDGGIKGPYLPLIDSVVPDFAESITAKIEGNNDWDYILPNGQHPWTSKEVVLTFKTVVGISGQRLQYQTQKYNDINAPWSEWYDVKLEDEVENEKYPAYNGVVDAFSGLQEVGKTTMMVLNLNTHSANYRFRVISGVNVESEIIEFGNILIDTKAPTLSVSAVSNGQPYNPNTWTRSEVIFTINVSSCDSGTTVQVSNDGINWFTQHGTLGNVMHSTSTRATLSRALDSLSYTGDYYYFRVTSGSGLEATNNFGIVKIDSGSALNMNIELRKIAEASIIYSGPDVIDYATTYELGINHDIQRWSSEYIMIKLNSTVGNSGAYVEYSNEGDDWKETSTSQLYFSNNNIVIANADDQKTQNVYILLKENQNRNYKFRIVSNSGVSKVFTLNNSIKIDKAEPYFKLSISEDKLEKSAKWTSDSVNDSYKWYTSELKIEFDVQYPISGATIYYRESYIDQFGNRVVRTENNDGKIIEWFNDIISNNGYSPGTKPSMTITHNASLVKTYEFKIVSGAGKEFDLVTHYSDESNREDLWTKSLTSDGWGMYTIQVDTTEYTISIEQWLKATDNLPGVTTINMASLVVKANSDKSLEANTANNLSVYKAKRGDTISVEINANAYNDSDGYGYIFKRVEYSGNILEGNSGEFFVFDIVDQNFNIMSYFTKEIKINYNNLYQIMQTQVSKPVKVDSGDRAVSELAFNIFYTGTCYYPETINYNESLDAPNGVGRYALKVTLANDNPDDPNYLIHNPEGSELIIVYFENKSASSTPVYEVKTVRDISYINIYNDPDPDEIYDFLGASRRNATYNQMNDIDIFSDDGFNPIYGSFTGIYNGNNYEIIFKYNIEANGTFGFFEEISGEVRNLGIRIPLLTVTDAVNVGFLAGSAKVKSVMNCYAIGEMHVSGENANIGGLIGYAYAQMLMSNNYTDIAMSNRGNNLSGNIGGLVGKIDYITAVNNYAIGAIEVYGINSNALNAGTFAGSILAMVESGDTSNGNGFFQGNKYLKGNLFINENVAENGGCGFIDASVYTSGVNEVEGLYFYRFIELPTKPGEINIANISIANMSIEDKYIKNLAMGRIQELGMNNGKGTEESPFEVNSKEALAFIDKYVWANYIQTADIIFEEGEEFETIAAHKVFNGSYNGLSGNVRYIIKGITINTTDKNTGIFGNVSGTIKNLDIRDLNVNINYNGTEDAYAGGIAAILLPGAKLEMVYVVGNIVASAPNAKLFIGGISGYAEGANLKDILSMANVKTIDVNSLEIGGTVGFLKNSEARKVYSLARVEGNYKNTGAVGAVIGKLAGADNNIRDCYALFGNTYAHGESFERIVGHTVPGSAGFQGEMLTFEEMRGSGFQFDTDQSRDLNQVLQDIYPFVGNGTINNPFLIYTVQQFHLINDFLYANYKIKSNLYFVNNSEDESERFRTIGVGSRFTGSISGAMTNAEYIQNGNTGPRSFLLYGLNDSLIYFNAGRIEDLRIHIEYDRVHYTDTTFGAIAVYNSGRIQSVVAEGIINIRVNGGAQAIVGGFVGCDLGGELLSEYGVQQPSYELSSINAIFITVIASQINAGGFVGRISGPTILSYLISEGDLLCIGGSVLAGTIAGAVLDSGMTFENEIESAARVIVNYVDVTQEYGFNINQ